MPKPKLKFPASYGHRFFTACEIEDIDVVEKRQIGETAIVKVNVRSVEKLFALGMTTASLPADTVYSAPATAVAEPTKQDAKPAKK